MAREAGDIDPPGCVAPPFHRADAWLQVATARWVNLTFFHTDTQGTLRAARITLAWSGKALAQDPNNGTVLGYSAYAHAALGEAERAKERMNRALLIDPDNWNMRYNFACVLMIYLKEIDAALDLLGPVFDKATVGIVNYAKGDPDFVALRDNPRFQAMVATAEARLAAEHDGVPAKA